MKAVCVPRGSQGCLVLKMVNGECTFTWDISSKDGLFLKQGEGIQGLLQIRDKTPGYITIISTNPLDSGTIYCLVAKNLKMAYERNSI